MQKETLKKKKKTTPLANKEGKKLKQANKQQQQQKPTLNNKVISMNFIIVHTLKTRFQDFSMAYYQFVKLCKTILYINL